MNTDRTGEALVVRPATSADREAWVTMRCALWPEASRLEHEAEVEHYPPEGVVLVAQVGDGRLVGFAEISIRQQAPGCDTDRIAYVEGWYVEPGRRRRGVGRALVAAAEAWARRQSIIEMASDALLENQTGIDAHLALGFEEVERVVCFRKKLTREKTA